MSKKSQWLLCALLLTLTCPRLNAQQVEPAIHVYYHQTPVRTVLADIQSKSGYGNCIDDALLKYVPPLTLEKDSITINELLKALNKNGLVVFTCHDHWISAQAADVHGKVIDENSDPIEHVNVYGNDHLTQTGQDGEFVLHEAIFDDQLTFTEVSRDTVRVKIDLRSDIHAITMTLRVDSLKKVDVMINNGYLKAPKDRLPGSFSFVNNKQINRTIAPSLLSAIQGKVAGMLITTDRLSPGGQPAIYIRGLATLYANSKPLIIVDNFVYEGDINAINPDDVESVTVLKDAAAASIWGARAANGVIVITTKKSGFNRRLTVGFNTSLTYTGKPNLFYMPGLSSADFVHIETTRYDSGYYRSELATDYALVSPVVDILDQFGAGKITIKDKNAKIQALASHDIRRDIDRYFYRHGVAWRNYLTLSAGTSRLNYCISLGYDIDQAVKVSTEFKRLTVNSTLSYRIMGFECTGSVSAILKKSSNDISLVRLIYPIGSLVDDSGHTAIAYSDVRQSYKEKVGKLLGDWNYRPLDELNKTSAHDNIGFWDASLSLKRYFLKYFAFTLMYRHFTLNDKFGKYESNDCYALRNLRNTYAENNNGIIQYVIPAGGLYTWQKTGKRVNDFRAQLNMDLARSQALQIAALAGIESSKRDADTASGQQYGYNSGYPAIAPADTTTYSTFYNPDIKSKVFFPAAANRGFDYFSSIFLNVGATLMDRYSISISGRIDESNLFGVRARKRMPLYSAGIKWNLGKERFLKNRCTNFSFKTSYGTSGNVNTSMFGYTTAERSDLNRYNEIPANIVNPANSYLRWERSNMINLAIEGQDLKKQYQFCLEYYMRDSRYLLAPTFQDPTLGSRVFWDNTAALKGKGFDFSLTGNHKAGKMEIKNLLVFSMATGKVVHYDQTLTQARQFVDSRYITPREGFPVNAMYAFKWAGLDHATGDPLGFLNGQLNKDYSTIVASSPGSLQYIGSTVPKYFGSISSVFIYDQWELATMISAKLAYYFRRGTISYADPYTVTSAGPNDYSNRWQHPGDEQQTSVPSFRVRPEDNRDFFYAMSAANVEKGDHIRLQDIKLTRNIRNLFAQDFPLHAFSIYLYAANLGVLWKRTKKNIDPDYLNTFPAPRTLTIGAKVEF